MKKVRYEYVSSGSPEYVNVKKDENGEILIHFEQLGESQLKFKDFDLFIRQLRNLIEYYSKAFSTGGKFKKISVSDGTYNIESRLRKYLYILNGVKFTGNIKGIETYGTMSVNKGRVYFCTDNKDIDGSSATDKFGHRYSWIVDFNVSNISFMLPDPIPENISKIIEVNLKRVTGFDSHICMNGDLSIGCKDFKFSEFERIYNNILEDFTDKQISVSEFDLRNVVKAVESVVSVVPSLSDALNSLKTYLKSGEIKKEPVKSKLSRDSKGRFIKN